MPGVGITATLSPNGLDMNPALAMMKATQCFENLAFSGKPLEAESNLLSKGLMEKNVTEKGFLEKNMVSESPEFTKETSPATAEPEVDPIANQSDDNDCDEEKNGELQSLVSSS